MEIASKKGIIALKITDQNTLYRSYMPFLQNGGLFIPTNTVYELGEEVFIALSLMDEPDKTPVAGTIVWITPPGAQDNQVAGIGVHFGDNDGNAIILRGKIENYLVDKKPDDPTYTM